MFVGGDPRAASAGGTSRSPPSGRRGRTCTSCARAAAPCCCRASRRASTARARRSTGSAPTPRSRSGRRLSRRGGLDARAARGAAPGRCRSGTCPTGSTRGASPAATARAARARCACWWRASRASGSRACARRRPPCARCAAPAELTVVALDPAHAGDLGADRVVGGLDADGMAALYRETDVLVKLSRVESLGLPPLEAFHCGVPCVVTPYTGHEDYVVHGENGAVVGFDDPGAVTAWLDRLAGDRELLARLSEGAPCDRRALAGPGGRDGDGSPPRCASSPTAPRRRPARRWRARCGARSSPAASILRQLDLAREERDRRVGRARGAVGEGPTRRTRSSTNSSTAAQVDELLLKARPSSRKCSTSRAYRAAVSARQDHQARMSGRASRCSAIPPTSPSQARAEPGDGLAIELVRGRRRPRGALAWDAGTATITGGARRLAAAPVARRHARLRARPARRRRRARGRPARADRPDRRAPDEPATCRSTVRERADLDAIAAASVVVLPVPGGAPPPAEAFAVLAAGRVLVTGRCEPTFGLQPGIDCFMEPTEDGAAQRAEAVLRWPEAFELMRALGRIAAERQRAEVVLRRLAVDAALGVGRDGARPSRQQARAAARGTRTARHSSWSPARSQVRSSTNARARRAICSASSGRSRICSSASAIASGRGSESITRSPDSPSAEATLSPSSSTSGRPAGHHLVRHQRVGGEREDDPGATRCGTARRGRAAGARRGCAPATGETAGDVGAEEDDLQPGPALEQRRQAGEREVDRAALGLPPRVDGDPVRHAPLGARERDRCRCRCRTRTSATPGRSRARGSPPSTACRRRSGSPSGRSPAPRSTPPRWRRTAARRPGRGRPSPCSRAGRAPDRRSTSSSRSRRRRPRSRRARRTPPPRPR